MLRSARVVGAVAIICAIIEIEFHLRGLRNTTVTYSLTLAILLFAVRWGRAASIAASVVAAVGFIIYFQEPIGKQEQHVGSAGRLRESGSRAGEKKLAARQAHPDTTLTQSPRSSDNWVSCNSTGQRRYG